MTIGSCRLPNWWNRSSFPLQVYTDSNLPDRYVVGVEKAVLAWNTAVEREFIVINTDVYNRPVSHERGSIHIRTIDLEDTHPGQKKLGDARRTISRSTGVVRSVLVRLDTDITDTYLVPTITHELGHALGLSHDDNSPQSIMYPSMWNSRVQRIFPADVRAVSAQLPPEAMSVSMCGGE